MEEDHDKEYTTFKSFYPFYLSQHSNPISRKLHYLGTSLVIALLVAVVINGQWLGLLLLPVLGYFFAWVGHFSLRKIHQLLSPILYTV